MKDERQRYEMSWYDDQMEADLYLINQQLDQYLSMQGEEYDKVTEAMRYAVMNAGKRLRPVLTIEFCRINGGNIHYAIPFACALEMIHCYSLIHDDLPCMDDDDLRRGMPSCHKVYGEAMALLAGDGLLTKAFEVTAKSPLAEEFPALAVRCMAELAFYAGNDGMIGGQVIDLSLEQNDSVFAGLLHKMYNLKTAALIKVACKMGAIIAGANVDQIFLAEEYGEKLGLSFQVIDDILDVTGTEEQLGKPIGSDQKNQKATYVSLSGIDESKQLADFYTNKALELISNYEDSDFLKKLTKDLLERQN